MGIRRRRVKHDLSFEARLLKHAQDAREVEPPRLHHEPVASGGDAGDRDPQARGA